MINVTRYDLNEDVETGESFISPVPESIEGPYVAYEDYAALQQKLDVMAAENAELKKALKGTVEWCYSDELPEIPATDAYLNSVRAEAVEGFTSDVVLKMRESGAGAYDYADIVEAQGQELVLSLRSGTNDTADKAGAK